MDEVKRSTHKTHDAYGPAGERGWERWRPHRGEGEGARIQKRGSHGAAEVYSLAGDWRTDRPEARAPSRGTL